MQRIGAAIDNPHAAAPYFSFDNKTADSPVTTQ
jgi:hypothetical protein